MSARSQSSSSRTRRRIVRRVSTLARHDRAISVSVVSSAQRTSRVAVEVRWKALYGSQNSLKLSLCNEEMNCTMSSADLRHSVWKYRRASGLSASALLTSFNSTLLRSIFRDKKASCRLLVPAIRFSELSEGDRSSSGSESSHMSKSVRICRTFLEISRDCRSCRPYTSGKSSPRISVSRHNAIWQYAALKRSVVRDPCGRRTSTVGSGTSYWFFAICGGTPWPKLPLEAVSREWTQVQGVEGKEAPGNTHQRSCITTPHHKRIRLAFSACDSFQLVGSRFNPRQ